MFAYHTPGVHFEWRDTRARAIAILRTDIAGFVGIAERGPLHRPLKVESWTQFTSLFGGHIPQGYLAYAVEGFFANGGQTCWVVRVADPQRARPARLTLLDGGGRPALELTAAHRALDARDQLEARRLRLANNGDDGSRADPGAWAHHVTVAVVRSGRDRFSLTVRPAGGAPEIWRNLSMRASDGQGRFVEDVINDPATGSRLVSARCLTAGPGGSDGVPSPQAPNLRNGIGRLAGGQDGLAPSVDLLDADTQARLRLVARVPTTTDQPIAVTVTPGADGRFELIVEHAGRQEPWRNLTMAPPSRGVTGGVDAVQTLNDPHTGSKLVAATDISPGLPFAGLAAAAAVLTGGLAPAHFFQPSWGLATFELIDEISIVAMPDIMPKPWVAPAYRPQPARCDDLTAEPPPPPLAETPPEYPPRFDDQAIRALQDALIGHCERLKDRVAILDPLVDDTTPERVLEWRVPFDSSYAALYYPWIMAPDPLRLEGLLRALPPSGHVAGVYARTDQLVGVHKPPANAVVEGALDTATAFFNRLRASPGSDALSGMDDIIHGVLNDRHVNVIRAYPGRGLRVAGARLLSSNSDFRYINVRRLLLMIEEAIDERTQWTVFEPNSPNLWLDIERAVGSFLNSLWRRGMLDGATAEDAYSVRCDAATNPPEETALGRVICEIGVQPPWPAEFVIVRIGKTESGIEEL